LRARELAVELADAALPVALASSFAVQGGTPERILDVPRARSDAFPSEDG
jgi:hypothetical protein